MNATPFRSTGFVLVAFVFGLSLATAQDNPPIVNSEAIDCGPFRPSSKASVELKRKTAAPARVEVAAVTMDPRVAATSLSDPVPPHLGVPTMSPARPFEPPSTREHQPMAAAAPAPLLQSDSKIFGSSPPPKAINAAAKRETKSVKATEIAARVPKMTKMFSFDTTDKVATNHVAPAFDQVNTDLTLNLNGPESVVVNQVFQQFVEVRNSSGLPLHEVRVTQVCDLSVLGAEQHQAVTIDCLEPGESKTVRFSARALQPGTFAVRYVVENSQIQADIDHSVQVCETETSSR